MPGSLFPGWLTCPALPALPPTMSKPKLTALPATLFLVGLGLSLHYGHAWWRLPVYTEQELENSVELNLALDLQREHRDQPVSDSELSKRREQLRAEVLALVDAEKKEKQSGLTAGLLMLILCLSYFVWLSRARAK